MLRDYQVEICEKVNEAFERHRSVMMQMPTGTGKTVVLASLVKQYLNKSLELREKSLEKRGLNSKLNSISYLHCQVLIVAHRIELIEQIGEHLKQYGIEYGVIASGRKVKETEHVIVASIQTLSSKLSSLSFLLSPSLVVIDEAHHALAKTYQMLWTEWPEARFLGLTATPYRMSGDGFTDLFEVMVESWSIKQFIADGWLSPYDYYSIRPDSEEQQEIDSLKKRGADGDFQMKELREKLDVRPSIERLFGSFERFAPDKKGIVYAIDIAHAEHIAEFYRLRGVNAVAISSMTPAYERQRLLERFKGHGSLEFRELSSKHNSLSSKHNSLSPIQVLVSVDLFSEGFDCPDVEFIQMARPTLSLAKYMQMVGRGLRSFRGKSCCTIIDNVGLYRTFGLPSVDRDWGAYFVGSEILGMRNGDLNNGDEQFLWLGCGDLREENDADIVRIVSHEGMRSRFSVLGRTGFERRKKVVVSRGKRKRVWVWRDLTNGVEFDWLPKVINYRGLEMSTADGETFFPRISSKWIDAKHGINRKALETQVGDGVGWLKLYVSFAMPERVLQLQSVKSNLVRIYKDEWGKVFLQQDLDHTPVSEEEVGGRKVFMASCDGELVAWEVLKRGICESSLKYDDVKGWWQMPEGCVKEVCEGLPGLSLYHIVYRENGECRELWVDGESGFTYRHRPVLRKRGFVELLYDGDVVYVLNICEERFMPYRNWEIRADGSICVIGNKLYLGEEKDGCSYRIKRRSDDFRMFVVEKRSSNSGGNKIGFDEFMIINEAGKGLEIRMIAKNIVFEKH